MGCNAVNTFVSAFICFLSLMHMRSIAGLNNCTEPERLFLNDKECCKPWLREGLPQ
jgi:hypothetical protein